MAENFVNIIRDIRGSTNDPATDTSCIYGDMKSMHEEYKGFKQITDKERLKLENIEEGATENSSDAFLLSRANHTGNMSIANVQDTPSRMAMTIHEKNKLEAINVNATANDTDANLRSRSTHTGTQSADSIVDGLVNAAYTLQEKNKNYMTALKAGGCGHARIIFRHVLRNILPSVIALATMEIGSIILSIAGFSFIGLGVQAPTPEWGIMLSDSRSYIQTYPRLMFYPGILIMIIVLAFNYLGEGIQNGTAQK